MRVFGAITYSFSHATADPQTSKPESRIKFKDPWIFGFTNSRPEDAFSSGRDDTCLARDIYRHPSRQGVPTEPFKKLHDVYALGVVLLEIGSILHYWLAMPQPSMLTSGKASGNLFSRSSENSSSGSKTDS